MKLIENTGIIVEFVGPPGGGKTTICNILLKSLGKEGLMVRDFASFKKYFHSKGLFGKLRIISKNTFGDIRVFRDYILLLLKAGVYNPNSFARYFKLRIFQSLFQEYIEKHKVDVFLLDQWSVQQLWSATIFRAKDYDILIKEISRFYYEPDVMIYLDVDTETARDRISSRTTGKSRFDRMKIDERDSKLKSFTEYLRALFRASVCENKIELSGLNKAEENAKVIISYLKNNTISSNQNRTTFGL